MADYTIRGDTKLDASGLNKGLSKLGSLASAGLGAVVKAGAAAATALVGVGTASVMLASDLTEVQNVVDVTFGDNAGQINDWAKAAAKAYGLSELAAKQYTGTLGAMLKSMGLADDQVLTMSEDMVGLAGDFASFYNLDPAEAFEKIRSGISGETEPLKQLGINMSVANLEAYALAEGITTAYKDMTQAEQATLRYNYLMSVSADAQGDFARTQDSLANQMRIAQLQTQELGSAIGQSLLPMATEAAKSANTMLEALKEGFDKGGVSGMIEAATGAVQQIAEGIAEAAPSLISTAGQLLVAVAKGLWQAAPTLMASARQILGAVVSTIGPAIATYGPQLWQAGLDLLGQIAEGLRTGIPAFLSQALPMLVQFSGSLREHAGQLVDSGLGLITSLVQGLIAALPDLIAYVPTIVTNIAGIINDNFPKILATGVSLIWQLITGIIQNIPNLIANAGQIVLAIISVISAVNWLSLGKKLLTAIINGIKKIGPKIPSTFKNLMDDGIQAIKKIDWLKLGKDIIKGIIAGLKNAKDLLVEALLGMMGSGVNAVMDFFEIGSPSKLMRDKVGRWLPAGVAEGVTDNTDTATTAMNNMAERMLDQAQAIMDNADIQAFSTRQADPAGGNAAIRASFKSEHTTTIEMDGRTVGKVVAPYVDEYLDS